MELFAQQPINATNTILDNLLDAVLVVNAEGVILYANPSAMNLFEKAGSALLNQPFGFPVMLHEVQEINVVKGGQLLTVQMLASSIEWNNNNASLVSLRDITAQKRMMEELEEQKALLERKNEENAQYASLASHDLKEPVRKILIFSDLLLRNKDRVADDQQKLVKIHSAATKMNQLINGIAELSRAMNTDHLFEQVDLKDIVAEVCDDLELQLQEKEGVVDAGPLPVIEAVPNKMYQLFLNLVSNSLKYARKDVKPCIRISSEWISEDRVQITLQDNGIGFDNTLAAQLFQPFKRLHNKEYDGIGVGLSICQRVVDLHRGEIKADGVEEEGAIFTILLPRYQKTASV